MIEKISHIAKNLFQAPYKNWDNIEVRLIVSSGRTGTKFIAQFFDKYCHNVLSLHEPQPDFFELGTQNIRQNLTAKEISEKILSKRWKQNKVVKKNKFTHYLESNNNLTLLLNHDLTAIFPNLKILWITRHPLTYVKSAYSKIHGTGYSIFSENDPRNRISTKDFVHENKLHDWEMMSRFEKICWHWYQYNKLCGDAQKLYGEKMMRVKYEDLFDLDTKTLDHVAVFLGLKDNLFENLSYDKIFATRSNQTKAYLLENKATWTTNQTAFFDKVTQSLATQLGYD